jgi:hypothetical protein
LTADCVLKHREDAGTINQELRNSGKSVEKQTYEEGYLVRS